MSKFTWSAAAVSLLLASSLAAQTAQQKPAATKQPAAAQAAPAKAAPAAAAATTAKDTTKAKGTKHADGTTATADQVKKAQQALADKGLYKGKVTGRSNTAFRAALKKYQTDNQLKATGRLNQETLAKLGIM